MPARADAANRSASFDSANRGAPVGRAAPAMPAGPAAPADPFPQDLARYLAASTGLPQPTAVRVVADVATYFSETIEEFVVGRHAELKRRQLKNDEIWPLITAELGARRFAAPKLSERQLRRMVYH
jgi:hypothetical protein